MRLAITLAAAAAAAGGIAAVPATALAQQAGNQSEVVVYGNDPCARSTDSSIVVCRHRPESERYRLPKNQQLQGSRQERQSWANRSRTVMNAGKTGINSCSAVGPAGTSGCLIQQIEQARRENGQATEDNSTPQ